MHPETLAALKGSIEKWEEIVNHDGADEFGTNCPLCQRFGTVCVFDDGEATELCPVAAKVIDSGCRGSPWIAWDRKLAKFMAEELTETSFNTPARIAWTDELAELAQKELDFLKSLLPADEQSCAS